MKILHTHLPRITKLVLLCLALILFPVQAFTAEDASFTWTANPEPYTGYKLYYKTGASSLPPYDGTGLNEGNSPILLGKEVTSYTLTGLSPNNTYHFVLTAYNETEESDYTTVITILPDAFPSPTINIMSQNN